jgi:hypothetical protein
MLIYEGLCETCYRKYEDEINFAEQKLAEGEEKEPCAICKKRTTASNWYGVCFECSSALVLSGEVTDVHNSITDPYKFIPHKCDDEVMCVGVIRADACLHVVHNREVDEGLCPVCFETKHGKED